MRPGTLLRSRSWFDTYVKSNRVNPVEVLYAAFPMFLYFDPGLGGLLLEPLLRYQAWPSVNPQYTARDAGKVCFLSSKWTSSPICPKERHTRIHQSPMKRMTRASSVRRLNPSYETSSCSEDGSSRDSEYAVDDLCPRSNERRCHPHPEPRWRFPRHILISAT